MSTLRREVTLEMPARKRTRYASGSRYKWGTKPKSLTNRTLPSQRTIIPLIADHTIDLTADPAFSYSFDTQGFYTNNGSARLVQGLDHVRDVYDLMRVYKVEFTILPAATDLALNNQTLATGVTNIPYLYTAVDYNDPNTPTISEIRQNPTSKVALFNKVHRRTIYPRLEGGNGVIDVGNNSKNIFLRSTASSSQHWNGLKLYIDMENVVWTYGSGRVSMKIYYECMQSK